MAYLCSDTNHLYLALRKAVPEDIYQSWKLDASSDVVMSDSPEKSDINDEEGELYL